MTKRVTQHQIEDLSRSKYSLAIPRNWVFRDKLKDYGIDAEVEIFDENGTATGLFYWVQLKATESNDASAVKNIDLSIESVKYYKSLDIPVLIARYSEAQDRFYCKWAHQVDLFYAKKDAKTIRISFGEEDVWNEDSANKTKEYLGKLRDIKNGRIKFPIPLAIVIKDNIVNGIPKGVFVSSFREALLGYPEFVIFQDELQDASFEVSLSGDELRVSLLSITGCTFHSIKKRGHEGFVEGITADTLIGCAAALSQIGQREMAARIVLDSRLKARFVNKKDVLMFLIPDLLKTSFFGGTIDVISDVIATENNNILEIITNMSALCEANPDDEEKSSKIEMFLKKCLDKYISLGEDSLIGISYYNLANHYRSRGLFQKSIRHYLKARRFEKRYLNQIYYYQELGGALFGYRKYHFSAMLYKMALDKGAAESVKPLFADALMRSGKYKLALDVFSEYLSSSKDEHDEWHLKVICLRNLIKRTGVKEQARRKEEALAAVDMKKAGGEDFVKSLESALELDMLCGLAWFNLGVVRSKAGNHEDAMFSFTMCGLIQTWDIEAWVNATVCCMNKEVPIQMLPLIVRTGYFFNGDRFLSRLYKDFIDRLDSQILVQLTNAIEEVLPKTRSKKGKPAFRLMGEDGIFRDIFEEKKA